VFVYTEVVVIVRAMAIGNGLDVTNEAFEDARERLNVTNETESPMPYRKPSLIPPERSATDYLITDATGNGRGAWIFVLVFLMIVIAIGLPKQPGILLRQFGKARRHSRNTKCRKRKPEKNGHKSSGRREGEDRILTIPSVVARKGGKGERKRGCVGTADEREAGRHRVSG
jgi:hypothetical protein